jgi:transcriptional regulator with PAS, ATPase and Fis domain
MFNDTLFGHTKGAYTGAAENRKGMIEHANGGTLFLDEIGELDPRLQVRLLRLLETREYYPLGSDEPDRAEARMVVATNRDLEEEVAAGRFRKDLYYRLKMHHIRIPPLRKRPRDIPLLTDHFVRLAEQEYGKTVDAVPPEIYDLLTRYSFPGNVRELRSIVWDAVSRHETGSLSPAVFREALGTFGDQAQRADPVSESGLSESLPTLKEATAMLIDQAIQRADGNYSRAARMLGITPQALSQRLKRQGHTQ